MFANSLIKLESKLGSHCVISVAKLSNVSNKRITRIASDLTVKKSELRADSNETLIDPKLVNRNPRNLEQLLFEPKTLGYELDLPERVYYNKVVLEKSGKFLSAKVVHYTNRVIASVSTRELALREQLKSFNDTNAAKIVAQVLANRALEAGVNQVFVASEDKEDNSVKMKEFLKSLEENGVALDEQPFIFPRRRLIDL